MDYLPKSKKEAKHHPVGAVAYKSEYTNLVTLGLSLQ